MIRIVLALATIILIFWAYNRWKSLPRAQRKQSLLKTFLIAALIVCLIAVFTGRLHWLGAVIAAAAALLKFGFHTIVRALPFLNILRRTPFLSEPQFKTTFLDVKIDLRNGQMFGSIISGPHLGKALNELSQSELEELELHYRDKDKASYFLIRVVRQRKGHAYESADQHQSFSSIGNPSIDEALQILGLERGCSKRDIVQAHRTLMQKLHPDRGGNDYLASRVNIAKEILIKNLENS